MELPPAPYLFVDVETTGLSHADRIVSLGTILIPSLDVLSEPNPSFEANHLVFNPGRPSHPRARKVHGYTDDVLANQELFSEYAPDLRDMFGAAGTVIAHNASFDERFIRNELFDAGAPLPDRRFYCTMRAYRTDHAGSAALKVILQQMGLSRKGKHHGALEDAWLAMQVFCWLHGRPYPGPSTLPSPVNFRTTPPVSGPQPAAIRTEQAPDPLSPEAARLSKRAKPVGTIMMAVADADGQVDPAELAVIYLMIIDVSADMSLGDDPEMLGQVFADIAQMDKPRDKLDWAADIITQDTFLSTHLNDWLKQVAYADGNGSQQEADALMAIAASLRNARTSAIT